jgi:hypothetical protein
MTLSCLMVASQDPWQCLEVRKGLRVCVQKMSNRFLPLELKVM